MKIAGKPGILQGAVTGALLTATLIGVSFAAWRIAGLPFVPFDAFDLGARVLPGKIISFSISAIVAVIRTLHLGPTSVVAKMVEQAIGVAGLFFTGVAGGMILFAILRVLKENYVYLLSILMGIAVGIPLMLISLHMSHTSSVPPTVGAVWILFTFILWGALFGLSYRHLSAEISRVSLPPKVVAEQKVSAGRLDRRRFLVQLGGVTAIITVSGTVVGTLVQGKRNKQSISVSEMRWSTSHPLPNAEAIVKPAPGTRPEFTTLEKHYRIDINTIPPAIDVQKWQLKFDGLISKPLNMSLNQLRSRETMNQFITLSCISNPIGGDLIGTTRWTGVSLQKLLPELNLEPEATHLKILSVDGFYEVVPLDLIRTDERVMLTYAWDGVPLSLAHGFPLRIYVPDVYGMKQPKWIESIEATDHWEPGYWVVRGWDKVAQMKATSVIDTVVTDATIKNEKGQTLVPIGGIAHAGARGISKVEIKIDDNPWQEVELRTPLSDLTWVIWRYNWPFKSGSHTFTVRCYDGSHTPQIVTPSPPDPSGATGLYIEKTTL